jgi:hypothetical protein
MDRMKKSPGPEQAVWTHRIGSWRLSAKTRLAELSALPPFDFVWPGLSVRVAPILAFLPWRLAL